jgi:hypothetical protein
LSPALWLCAAAYATDVVWIGTPTQEDVERVHAAAGASGPPLTPQQFVDGATAAGPADDEAYLALEKTLERVRTLEDRLDGELIIMHDLEAAVSAIPIVRNDRDRIVCTRRSRTRALPSIATSPTTSRPRTRRRRTAACSARPSSRRGSTRRPWRRSAT